MDSLAVGIFTTTGVLLFFAVTATILRLIARLHLVKAFGVDDVFMVITLGCYIVYCCWIFYGRSRDLGGVTQQLAEIESALYSFYFAELFYIATTGFLKLSLGTFLLRLVKSRTQIYVIYTTLFITTCYTTIFFFMTMFQCAPAEHFWLRGTAGKCLSPDIVLGMTYGHSAVTAGSDFLFAFLPILLVWKLKMNKFMKFSVASLLGLGAVAGVTTIARIPFINALVNNGNFFNATGKLAMLSSIEPGLGIIAGSGAALRPLFASLFSQSIFSRNSRNSRARSKILKSSQQPNMTISRAWNSHSHSLSKSESQDTFDFSSLNLDAEDVTTVVVIHKGRKFCYKCDDTEVCGRCGDHMHHHANESQETLTAPAQSKQKNDIKNGIYRDISVKRVVEFLTDE